MAQQPCETCQKYAGGCSWSRDFTPVLGWDATPTEKRGSVVIHSYAIHHCPEYVPDPPRRVKKEKRAYGIDRLAVLEMLSKDTPVSEIADTFECCDGTIYEIRRELRREGLLI